MTPEQQAWTRNVPGKPDVGYLVHWDIHVLTPQSTEIESGEQALTWAWYQGPRPPCLCAASLWVRSRTSGSPQQLTQMKANGDSQREGCGNTQWSQSFNTKRRLRASSELEDIETIQCNIWKGEKTAHQARTQWFKENTKAEAQSYMGWGDIWEVRKAEQCVKGLWVKKKCNIVTGNVKYVLWTAWPWTPVLHFLGAWLKESMPWFPYLQSGDNESIFSYSVILIIKWLIYAMYLELLEVI